MTKPLQMAGLAALPILAAVIGFAITSPPNSSGLGERLASWPDLAPPADYTNSVDRIISEVSSMHLFGRDPNVVEDITPEAGELEALQDDGLGDLTLIASFSRDGKPFGTLEDPSLGMFSVTEGDEVAESWTVTSISRSDMVLTRDGEFKTLTLPSALEGN